MNYEEHTHEHTVYGELLCHLPYAIFSVALSLAILSFFAPLTLIEDPTTVRKGAKILFHSFHFMHIAFAATGTLVTFFRFSKNVVTGLLIGSIFPTFFCILSDAAFPYVAGRILGVPMTFHLCIITEAYNVLPFLLVGVINGFVLSRHKTHHQQWYGLTSHALHILVSSIASTFYLVAYGFNDWYTNIGVVFFCLIIAVVIPCTFSDVVVPMAFAKKR